MSNCDDLVARRCVPGGLRPLTGLLLTLRDICRVVFLGWNADLARDERFLGGALDLWLELRLPVRQHIIDQRVKWSDRMHTETGELSYEQLTDADLGEFSNGFLFDAIFIQAFLLLDVCGVIGENNFLTFRALLEGGSSE